MIKFLEEYSEGKKVDQQQMNKFVQTFHANQVKEMRNASLSKLDEVITDPQDKIEAIKEVYKYLPYELSQPLFVKILAKDSIDSDILEELGLDPLAAYNIAEFVKTGERRCLYWE